MNASLEQIETLVRDRICKVCTERTVDGDCGREQPSECALFRLFPEVARAVQSVQSDNIEPYIDAIRRQVCSICVGQDADGDCLERRQVQCALDAYLMLVVDAIEEAAGKTFDRSGLTGGRANAIQLEVKS